MLNFLLDSVNGKQNNSGLQTLETPMSTSEKLSSVNRLKGDACTLHAVWLLEQSTFSQCEIKICREAAATNIRKFLKDAQS